MILDSSVIVSIFFKEPGWADVFEKIMAAKGAGIGTPTLVESGIVITARQGHDGKRLLSRFIQEFGVAVVPFGETHWQVAIDAYRRFGKGRHPASLNFGDCMSYATAHRSQQPLLCVGDDFPRTDLEMA